jgi:hypothetical protein
MRFSIENKFKDADRRGCIIRNKVCDLLGISQSAGYKWFDRGIMPKGVNRLKLFVLLELLGFVVEERQQLTSLQRQVSDCLVFSSATLEDIAALASTNSDTVLRWANGFTEPVPSTVRALEEALSLYKSEIAETLKRWQESIGKIGLESSHQRPQETSVDGPSSEGSSNVLHDHVVERVAMLVKSLEPLARRLVSDEFSPEDRKRLRELTALQDQSHSVFELSTHLNRLCGEKARRELC